MLPEVCRLRALLGLPSFFTVRPGVLILLGVALGDGFTLGVRWGLDGVVFGVTMTGFPSCGGERGALLGVVPGDFAGVRAGDLEADAAKGVDRARVRGVEGTVLAFTRVSESDVTSETAVERTLRRDAATEGAEGPFRGIGTLFVREVEWGVVVDLLREDDTLGVDRKEEGGVVALDKRRVGTLALKLLTRRDCSWPGTGVALGDRGAGASFDEPLTLRPPGTMVVTPLTLLEREAVE